MNDIFQIGNAHFEFAAETQAEFIDGGMRFVLQAKPVRYDPQRHAPAFEADNVDNPEESIIAPQFGTYGPFFFYDKTGEAQRVVRLPQRQPAVHDFHLYERGFTIEADNFHGEAILTPSLVELRGVMKPRYRDDAPGVPIHVRRNFPPGAVTLQPHTYTSLAEAAEVAPEQVRRFLLLQGCERGTPPITAFPPELLRFNNLEFLSLQFGYPQYAPFTRLPDAFCELARLKEIHIRCSSIEHLPDNIGALQQLEIFCMEYGKLQSVPDSIGRLARLQRLRLPGNALKTLPDCIGHLPALQWLNIERNPFASLPDSLQRIEKVELENSLKALYQDIRYRPEVDVAVDPEQFLARSSTAHAALLEAACRRHKLQRYLPVLQRLARNSVRYRSTSPEDYAEKGNTRFGGAPDLPPGMAFPLGEDGTHWRFYAQLRLADVAELQNYLPREGVLYFFGQDQEQLEHLQVFHSTAATESLVTYAYPADTRFEDGGDRDDRYPGFKAQASATVSVPHLYNAQERFSGKDAMLLEIEDDKLHQQAYWALQEELCGKRERCHLVNAHVFTQHETPEEQASAAKGGLPGEWVNLLVLESDNRPGFCFWDAGTLTFSIHQKALALGDFSDVVASLESS